MSVPIIGIDLGTTNSCAAVANEQGEITLIPYRGGEFTIPSVFAIDKKGKELVGYEAWRQWQLNPQKTVFGAKRMIGVNFESELVTEMRKRAGYEITPGHADDVLIKLDGTELTLAQVSAKILGKICEVASEYLGQKVQRAVVTVPAYFNDRQRQAVHEAGDIIGLEIAHIINEPTAAAIAHGARRQGKESVAVYDLGGGTFDISVIEIRDRVFEVKATGGDVFLGGIDFDNALIQYVLADFRARHDIDISGDPVAMQRVRDMAERVKVDLSVRQEAPLTIPFIAVVDGKGPLDLDMIVRRDELEELTSPLVERTFDTCSKVLDDAGLAPNDVDQVILVGGQTRMPLIQERIRDFFGRAPSKTVHPDEAVAIGAALYAWSLDERSDLSFQLLDVLPMAIGIEAADHSLRTIFERNAPVPNQKMLTFTTHRDKQKDLVMSIFQGDHGAAADNTLLGKFTFSGIREANAGEVRVEVVFDVSAEGILSLAARDLDTEAKMQQTVQLSR